MKKFLHIRLLVLLFMAGMTLLGLSCKKTGVTPEKQQHVTLVNDTITKDGITLLFINTDTAFQIKGDSVRKNYEKTFFIVYPQIMAYFNPDAPHTVTMLMDTAYDGIAATGGDVIHFDPGNSLDHPHDLNVITHEVTHVIQQYHYDGEPAWLTEGIADYSKNKFGVPYGFDGWYIADYAVGDDYHTGYGIVTRFILWAEAKYNTPMVQTLDKAMRDGTYDNDKTWEDLTGSTFDQLWNKYIINPYF
ncbi:MAG TPA: basic secretory protein-like protein [Mucilaginibacter sp.]|nr:basic secretory protein-like protein [Mucilaginibacter sp.]